jgi:AraC family transcriptional regulator of adaptative response / DNA-3-methyladenine glycosylase II
MTDSESMGPASVQVERPLGYTPPFDAAGVISFLSARAVPGVEEVDTGALRYRRAERLDGPTAAVVTLDLGSAADAHEVVLRVDSLRSIPADVLDALTVRCRHLLDLDADPVTIGSVVAADPALAPLVEQRPGLRVPGAWDPFELVARAVLGQQVSVAAARTLLGRLAALCGPDLAASIDPAGPSGPDHAADPAGAVTHRRLFPAAADVAGADLDRLGVPASRRRSLRAVAEAVADGSLRLERGAEPAMVSAQLRALPGIGPWTAAYVALRALGDGDSFLVGDVALAHAAARRGLPDRWPALVAHAERWRPWRGYASLWLWSALAD